MTRSELVHAIAEAERESSNAAHSLRMLRKMVEFVLEVNGDLETVLDDNEMPDGLAALASATKPTLRAWAAVCSRDPLLACLIASRRKYAKADDTRGKGVKRLDVAVNISYQDATAVGFKGSRNQWEALLRLR